MPLWISLMKNPLVWEPVMSVIGPTIYDPDTLDWDTTSFHGSFHIFNNKPDTDGYLLRCVVWRDDRTGAVVGHNFDYTRASSRDWWTADEAGTPEECLQSVAPSLREQAARAVAEFRAATYQGLMDGSVGLHEVRQRAVPLHAPEVVAQISLKRLALNYTI
jgi:hypothetical protein